MDILERIMLRVKVNEIPHPVVGTPCWEWQGSKPKGYGYISVKNKSRRVHRLMYELRHGELPDSMNVLHRCDNPPCCNPEHLFLGTDADNAKDCGEKGRRPTGDRHWSKAKPELIVNGERHGMSKLTKEAVEKIVSLSKSILQQDVAEAVGVSCSTVCNILKGKIWSHVTGIKPKVKT